jgi:hypothetical protein
MTSTPFRSGLLRGGIAGFAIAILGAGIVLLTLRSTSGETLELINYGLYFLGLPVSHLYFVVFPKGTTLERTITIMIGLMTINWAMIGGLIALASAWLRRRT